MVRKRKRGAEHDGAGYKNTLWAKLEEGKVVYEGCENIVWSNRSIGGNRTEVDASLGKKRAGVRILKDNT